jgi:hypothetical protein
LTTLVLADTEFPGLLRDLLFDERLQNEARADDIGSDIVLRTAPSIFVSRYCSVRSS